jgi:hypothetical protein
VRRVGKGVRREKEKVMGNEGKKVCVTVTSTGTRMPLQTLKTACHASMVKLETAFIPGIIYASFYMRYMYGIF